MSGIEMSGFEAPHPTGAAMDPLGKAAIMGNI
jgi:hypothetical protein